MGFTLHESCFTPLGKVRFCDVMKNSRGKPREYLGHRSGPVGTPTCYVKRAIQPLQP